MEKIVSLCKRRGFIYQSSEIYGGINGFWDYGPLGAELKRNVKDLWWRRLVQDRDDVAGLDATIIMAPQIWKASGHVDTFADLMVECLLTRKRFRADQIEPQSGTAYHYLGAIDRETFRGMIDAAKRALSAADPPGPPGPLNTLEQLLTLDPAHQFLSPASPLPDRGSPTVTRTSFAAQVVACLQELRNQGWLAEWRHVEFAVLLPTGKHPGYAHQVTREFYQSRGLKDPILIFLDQEPLVSTSRFNPENGALLTEPRPFNLMFKTYVGPVADEESVAYLRPETAQAIFAQFKNVLETSRQKVPFGIAQVGKAFRNEVTPRNFTFRSR